MNTQAKIKRLVQADGRRRQIEPITAAKPKKDRNHVQRRQQQRAISDSMIEVALMYGKKHHNRGAILYILGDRSLKRSPYAQFTDVLRGLTVVCEQQATTPHVLTAYWHTAMRRRVRK